MVFPLNPFTSCQGHNRIDELEQETADFPGHEKGVEPVKLLLGRVLRLEEGCISSAKKVIENVDIHETTLPLPVVGTCREETFGLVGAEGLADRVKVNEKLNKQPVGQKVA